MKWWIVIFFSLSLGLLGAVWLEVGRQKIENVLVEANEVITEAETMDKPSVEVEMSIMAVGDVMLGRSVNTRMLRYQDDSWPFEQLDDLLRSADISLGNLENPLISNCLPTDEGMIFCGRVEAARAIADSGFDGMSLANNHMMNYGTKGIEETKEELGKNGLRAIGEGDPQVLEINGVRVGVASYDDVSKRVEVEIIQDEVEELKASVDVVVVLIHWGVEYVDEPTERQQELGKVMIDAGVDIVFGSHPHWTQPVEKYGNGLIFYSLGNLVFDQMWSEETRRGEIARVEIRLLPLADGSTYELKGIDYTLIPVLIEDYGQPQIIDEGL
jgi:poly-gamma-glutamate synthesis protein (capsule biosynthesis protein)